MKRTISLVVAVLAILVVMGLLFPQKAPADDGHDGLVLYDDFNSKLIDPDKWRSSQSNARILEVSREIKLYKHYGRLYVSNRAYGNTDSDAFLLANSVNTIFNDTTNITAIKAKVKIKEFDLVGCADNPDPSRVRARIFGWFFNASASAPGPGDRTNDVGAVIEIIRTSDSTNPEGVLRVRGLVLQCNNPACAAPTTVLSNIPLGTVKRGQNTKLLVKWIEAEDKFIFKKDEQEETAPYTVPDGLPPTALFKALIVSHNVANCTTEPRPFAFMKVKFDDVFVNEEAAP